MLAYPARAEFEAAREAVSRIVATDDLNSRSRESRAVQVRGAIIERAQRKVKECKRTSLLSRLLPAGTKY